MSYCPNCGNPMEDVAAAPDPEVVAAHAEEKAVKAASAAEVEIARIRAEAEVAIARIQAGALRDEVVVDAVVAEAEADATTAALAPPPEPEPVPIVVQDNSEAGPEPTDPPGAPESSDSPHDRPKAKSGLGYW